MSTFGESSHLLFSEPATEASMHETDSSNATTAFIPDLLSIDEATGAAIGGGAVLILALAAIIVTVCLKLCHRRRRRRYSFSHRSPTRQGYSDEERGLSSQIVDMEQFKVFDIFSDSDETNSSIISNIPELEGSSGVLGKSLEDSSDGDSFYDGVYSAMEAECARTIELGSVYHYIDDEQTDDVVRMEEEEEEMHCRMSLMRGVDRLEVILEEEEEEEGEEGEEGEGEGEGEDGEVEEERGEGGSFSRDTTGSANYTDIEYYRDSARPTENVAHDTHNSAHGIQNFAHGTTNETDDDDVSSFQSCSDGGTSESVFDMAFRRTTTPTTASIASSEYNTCTENENPSMLLNTAFHHVSDLNNESANSKSRPKTDWSSSSGKLNEVSPYPARKKNNESANSKNKTDSFSSSRMLNEDSPYPGRKKTASKSLPSPEEMARGCEHRAFRRCNGGGDNGSNSSSCSLEFSSQGRSGEDSGNSGTSAEISSGCFDLSYVTYHTLPVTSADESSLQVLYACFDPSLRVDSSVSTAISELNSPKRDRSNSPKLPRLTLPKRSYSAMSLSRFCDSPTMARAE